ncbi:MAG: DsrE/DsrF/DrsH-like family protein [Proteobacteria bacterium]|nr:DsrE/DsrF/DrsH-like family protein [Pseudomonadota bacterium]
MSDANKISIIVLSDKREQLQMAAMIASVGAVSGNEVLVFLSMNALRYFARGSDIHAPAEGPVGELIDAKNVPPFKTLFEQAVSLGDAKIHPCSMAMDLLGLEHGQLEDYVGEAMGLTMFLDAAQGGQVWSF